ncbi:hypothetical protein GCM10010918_45610 [Paenibacillus radicis (ex Gao et al. 2016)]|uniref:DUF2515 domain-containing protein n=1 Tax=Paenibacillus radicis (ex Gao et al. 2016) TaxID=1737354 RepID=A0A917HLG0_9BACL|nr:hypothetical protein GCM10010918_45610 [Paenibacillus radicis (ex Gao et al. 2016)]
MPLAALRMVVSRRKEHAESQWMAEAAEPLRLQPELVAELVDEWSGLSHVSALSFQTYTQAEQALVTEILTETTRCNRNNRLRTEAYGGVFTRTPELHWALLAHSVSRNGGWNMTDLQGEWLPRLLLDEQREAVFAFLERANALIFQDAYPQLLLYEQSVKQGRPLFHLLPAFGVSRFMRPVWDCFWKERDSAVLTTALIVNEQHYIEERLVRHPYFRKEVLDTLFFGMQPLLQLNALLIPYRAEGELRLAGLVLESFNSIYERIEFGKRLYAMLFGVPRIRAGALSFVGSVPHSGSRADYAPRLFTRMREGAPEEPYEARLKSGSLLPGAHPMYSPELEAAWPDRPVEPPEPGDWFQGVTDVEPFFHELPIPPSFELTEEYGLLLERIELGVQAAEHVNVKL